MGLKDMLENENKAFHDELVERMKEMAGEDMMASMLDNFKTENAAFEWFYNGLSRYENKSPYQLIKAGDRKVVETVLGYINYSIIG